MFIAMFLLVFGLMGASTAMAMGPDAGKAKRAAMKIFTIMRVPSKVDVMAPDLSSKKPVPEGF